MRPSRHVLAAHAALAPLALAAVLATGCAGPRPGPEHAAVSPPSAVAPGDELERELLRRLPELPAEQSVSIDDATVIATAPYFAASGRTCRALTISGPSASGSVSGSASGGASRARLACREDGDWFFVPPIFQTTVRSETPAAGDRP